MNRRSLNGLRTTQHGWEVVVLALFAAALALAFLFVPEGAAAALG